MNKHIAALTEEMRSTRMSPAEWLEALNGAAQLLGSFSTDGFDVEVVDRRKPIRFTEDEARALFTLAGFAVSKIWRLENGYWPDSYIALRIANPWWLVKTEIGLIAIGWRKRVLSIDWSETNVRAIVTEDDATKGDDRVHAYSTAKALEYLSALRKAAGKEER